LHTHSMHARREQAGMMSSQLDTWQAILHDVSRVTNSRALPLIKARSRCKLAPTTV
jgi:hypothetical protein